MRAEDPADLATLLPLALERQAPVIMDVPVGHLPLPRAKQHAHIGNLPWTQPQEGLMK